MQNGAVEKDYIDRMLEKPFEEIKRAVKDSLRQCYLQELDKGKVSCIIKMQLKEREIADPTNTRMNATMEVTDIEFEHVVKHQVVIDETSKGKFYDPDFSVEFDSAGNATFAKIKKAQTTLFDEDSASNWGRQVDSSGNVISISGSADPDEDEPDESDFDAADEF